MEFLDDKKSGRPRPAMNPTLYARATIPFTKILCALTAPFLPAMSVSVLKTYFTYVSISDGRAL